MQMHESLREQRDLVFNFFDKRYEQANDGSSKPMAFLKGVGIRLKNMLTDGMYLQDLSGDVSLAGIDAKERALAAEIRKFYLFAQDIGEDKPRRVDRPQDPPEVVNHPYYDPHMKRLLTPESLGPKSMANIAAIIKNPNDDSQFGAAVYRGLSDAAKARIIIRHSNYADANKILNAMEWGDKYIGRIPNFFERNQFRILGGLALGLGAIAALPVLLPSVPVLAVVVGAGVVGGGVWVTNKVFSAVKNNLSTIKTLATVGAAAGAAVTVAHVDKLQGLDFEQGAKVLATQGLTLPEIKQGAETARQKIGSMTYDAVTNTLGVQKVEQLTGKAKELAAKADKMKSEFMGAEVGSGAPAAGTAELKDGALRIIAPVEIPKNQHPTPASKPLGLI